MKIKKIALITMMSGLTLSSTSACYWQYRRYHDSLFRWGRIFSQFDQVEFPVYKVNDLPLSQSNIDASQFSIFQVAGIINPKIILVDRYKQSRAGCLFLTCLTDNDQGYALNLGWVPVEKIQQTLLTLASKENKMTDLKCMVRRAEVKPPIHKTGEKLETYIDLEGITKEFNLENPLAKKFYLDRIGEESSQYVDVEIYPVPQFLSSFEMPYMTPSKHQAYYVFWGSCTCVGLLTILRLLKL